MLLSEVLDRFACYQKRFDKPHRSTGETQAAAVALEEERNLQMESHLVTKSKNDFILTCKDCIAAREAGLLEVFTWPCRPEGITLTII